jgi:prophage endopeptidase
MTPLSLIPLPWKIGAALVLAGALAGAGVAYHHHVYQQGFDAAVEERAARDLAAVVNRVGENTAIGIKQDSLNKFLTKDKDEKLAPVVQRIYVDRVRVGPAICVGPAAPAQAESAGGSDGTDTGGRLVRSDIERDLRALKVAVEKHFATGRTCQAFVTGNGLAP